MNEWMNEWVTDSMNEWMNEPTKGQMNKLIKKWDKWDSEWLVGWIHEQTSKTVSEC